jgi:hypothetical protein
MKWNVADIPRKWKAEDRESAKLDLHAYIHLNEELLGD